jgi:hypothetical protein
MAASATTDICHKHLKSQSMRWVLLLCRHRTNLINPQDPSQPNNLAATIMNVQAGRCRPLSPSISQGCRAVIAGLLNPNPEARTRLEVRRHLRVISWSI